MRMSVFTISFASVLGCILTKSAFGTDIYLFNNTIEIPGRSTLLKLNVETKDVKIIANDTSHPQAAALSSAIICDSTYYTVWADAPVASGILAVDLNSGDFQYQTSPNGEIFHSLHCGANSSSLKAVASVVEGSVNFVLFDYDFSNAKATKVGAFPSGVLWAGYDNIFQFTRDGKYVYAQFPNNGFAPKITSGSLYIMDTSSGSIEGPLKYPWGVGMPYDVFPSDDNGDSFSGSFFHPKAETYSLCALSKSANGNVDVSDCKPQSLLNTHSVPKPLCKDGFSYALELDYKPGGTQILSKIDVKHRTVSQLYDIAEFISFPYVAAIAC